MVEHVTAWLGAYLDGELHGMQLQKVRSHLADCQICQTELESLRNLSAYLKEAPLEADLTPTARFTAQIGLRLPQRQLKDSSRKLVDAGWWLVPLGLLVTLTFVHVTLLLSTMVDFAGQIGLLGNAAAWLSPGTPSNEWLFAGLNLLAGNLNGPGHQMLQVLSEIDTLGDNILAQFSVQIGILTLYWGWLIVWWMRYRRESANNGQTTASI